ncbi:MAG: SH3 domain-containing protein [Verrucomicrobiales bacterium]|nr:SH3 domain-containing protein [Verrucomicrobiales bacterium]MCP5528209.1 SH3 domain-containing protein [Verrucomicrobiales bacterium]
MSGLPRLALTTCLTALTAAGVVALGEEPARVLEPSTVPARVLPERLNVRSQPSLAAEVVTQLRQGDVVEVRGGAVPGDKGAGWSRIALPEDRSVWVFVDYVDRTSGRVKANELRVRAGPGTEHAILGNVGTGDVLEVRKVVGDWVEVAPPNGTFVFVATEFIEFEHASASAPTVPATPTADLSAERTPPVAASEPEPALPEAPNSTTDAAPSVTPASPDGEEEATAGAPLTREAPVAAKDVVAENTHAEPAGQPAQRADPALGSDADRPDAEGADSPVILSDPELGADESKSAAEPVSDAAEGGRVFPAETTAEAGAMPEPAAEQVAELPVGAAAGSPVGPMAGASEMRASPGIRAVRPSSSAPRAAGVAEGAAGPTLADANSGLTVQPAGESTAGSGRTEAAETSASVPEPMPVPETSVEPDAASSQEAPVIVIEPAPQITAEGQAGLPAASDAVVSELPEAGAGGPGAEAAPTGSRRVVVREGVVRGTLSIQAPGAFELRSPETRERVVYLHPRDGTLEIRQFHGKRVRATGEEFMDPRWPLCPVLFVEQITLAP